MVGLVQAVSAISNIAGSSPVQGVTAINASSVSSSRAVSFQDILLQLSDAVGDNLQNAEVVSTKQILGSNVSMSDVVNSVMAAERSLSTAIAIRDKVVQAYTEITRMQI